MADAQLELQMLLKDAKVQTGLDALVRKEDDVEKGAKQIAKSVKLADEMLTSFANRTKSINSTPLEKYNRQLELLAESYKRGKINQDDYTRGVQRATAELEKQTTVLAEVAEEQQAVAEEQQAFFGPEAAGQVASLVGGYVTLQGAINLVAEAFRFARQESEEALGSLRGLDDSRRRLNQIATSPEDLQAKMGRADAAAAKFGVDRGTAYQALFDAYNYQIPGEYENIMAGRHVFDPAAATKVGGKLPSLFPGLKPMEAVNMTLAAAAASEADFEDFASVVPIAGEGGRIAGASPEETLAGVGVLGSSFKSSAVAADRLKNIMTKIGLNPELQGKGLLGGLDALQAMSPEARGGILGDDQESNAAYLALVANEQKIRDQAGELAKARGGGPLRDALARAEATPQLVASGLVARGEVNAELEKERQLGIDEAARQAVATGQAAAANQQNLPFWQRATAAAGRGVAISLGLDAEGVAAAGAAGQLAGERPALFTSGPMALGSPAFMKALYDEWQQRAKGQNEFEERSIEILREVRDALKRSQPRIAQNEAAQRAQ